MSLATSCDIMRHHAIGSGSGSGAGGVRCHSTEGVAEERRGGGSGSGGQTGVGSGSGRRAGVGSIRGSPYNSTTQIVGNLSNLSDRIPIGKVNSDRTTRNYFQPVSDQNQVVPTGSDRKDSQKSNINRSPDIRINQRH